MARRKTFDKLEGMTGALMPTCATSAPAGWLMCNGQAVSRTTYAVLFAILGTTWGTGDGSTTFNVPDLRGRVVIGVGTGSGLTARAMGANVGNETHVLDVTQIPAHSHLIGSTSSTSANGTQGNAPRNLAGAPVTYASESVGGGLAHNNMQPSHALNYMIAA